MHKPVPPPLVDSILQVFRGDPKAAISLHPLEQALLVIVGMHLCFMPWALGTMPVWSQCISLGLAMAGLVIALINRHYTAEYSHTGAFMLIMWPKLVCFPVFWLGLAFLGYIVSQALNPAWILALNHGYSWLVPIEHITWLPAGIEAPFHQMNAWRALMIYGSAWLLVCALWVGVTRRATLQYLLTIVVVNGAVLSVLGILQRAMGTNKIFWLIENSGNLSCFSTFIYKNHAGAYFNLVLMISVALAHWHSARGERRMQRSNPASFFAFCAVLLGISVILTNSRAATLLLIGFSCISFLGFIVRHRSSNDGESRNFMTIGALCGIFILFIALGSIQLGLGPSFERVSELIQTGSGDASVSARLIAQKATWYMAKDNLTTGWGAGSFRHIFPTYQRNYPEIYDAHLRPNHRLYWEYAHNDYIQLIDEFGLIGAGFFLAMAVCALRCLIKNRFYQRAHLLLAVLALVIILVHGWMDFPSHNPAILLLGCASVALVCRWAELESRRT